MPRPRWRPSSTNDGAGLSSKPKGRSAIPPGCCGPCFTVAVIHHQIASMPALPDRRTGMHHHDQSQQADRFLVRAAGPGLRRDLHRMAVHPDGLDLTERVVADHPPELRRAPELPRCLCRLPVLGIAAVHSEIHPLPHPDPHDRGLSRRLAGHAQQRAEPFHPHHRLHTGRDRARAPPAFSGTGCSAPTTGWSTSSSSTWGSSTPRSSGSGSMQSSPSGR